MLRRHGHPRARAAPSQLSKTMTGVRPFYYQYQRNSQEQEEHHTQTNAIGYIVEYPVLEFRQCQHKAKGDCRCPCACASRPPDLVSRHLHPPDLSAIVITRRRAELPSHHLGRMVPRQHRPMIGAIDAFVGCGECSEWPDSHGFGAWVEWVVGEGTVGGAGLGCAGPASGLVGVVVPLLPEGWRDRTAPSGRIAPTSRVPGPHGPTRPRSPRLRHCAFGSRLRLSA